jgi:uncharacterized repeat protein (TIGR03847 family)
VSDSPDFELPVADWVTVGVVGEPGRRTFYLQARDGVQLLTLKVEKQQVAALAEYLQNMLADLPEVEPSPDLLDAGLTEPVDPAWAVGPMGVAYDNDLDVILLEARERLTEDSRGEPAVARIGLPRALAASLAIRGAELVASGRPPCPACGHPLDSEHVCPKSNGHRPPGL